MTDPIVLQATGDVKGPASSTNNSMVLFSGTSGKVIKGNNAVVTAAGLALLDDNNDTEQRNTLGLGSMATQNNNAVTISGGNVSGLSSLHVAGTSNSVPTPPYRDSSTKIANTAFVQQNGVPVGTVVMWCGSQESIPSGWKLCNGVGTISNGQAVPNMIGRFPYGAGYLATVNQQGGTLEHSHGITVNNHTLTVDQMPNHAHYTTLKRDRSPGSSGNAVYGDEKYYGTDDVDTNAVGGSQPHSHGASSSNSLHVPPYHGVWFIIKD